MILVLLMQLKKKLTKLSIDTTINLVWLPVEWSQKTNMIAVIVSDITNPYFNQFVAILEKRLLLAGYTLSLFDSQTALTTDKSSVLAIETKIVNQIRENHFDATIILGGLIDRLNIPLKTISRLLRI